MSIGIFHLEHPPGPVQGEKHLLLTLGSDPRHGYRMKAVCSETGRVVGRWISDCPLTICEVALGWAAKEPWEVRIGEGSLDIQAVLDQVPQITPMAAAGHPRDALEILMGNLPAKKPTSPETGATVDLTPMSNAGQGGRLLLTDEARLPQPRRASKLDEEEREVALVLRDALAAIKEGQPAQTVVSHLRQVLGDELADQVAAGIPVPQAGGYELPLAGYDADGGPIFSHPDSPTGFVDRGLQVAQAPIYAPPSPPSPSRPQLPPPVAPGLVPAPQAQTAPPAAPQVGVPPTPPHYQQPQVRTIPHLPPLPAGVRPLRPGEVPPGLTPEQEAEFHALSSGTDAVRAKLQAGQEFAQAKWGARPPLSAEQLAEVEEWNREQAAQAARRAQEGATGAPQQPAAETPDGLDGFDLDDEDIDDLFEDEPRPQLQVVPDDAQPRRAPGGGRRRS